MPSAPIKTLAEKIIRVTTTSSNSNSLAAPAFALSRSAETRTVGILSSGYSISSTGGTIASYSITPAPPAGLTFSTSDGLITGRATETRTATTHTITATNATGSASRTLSLRVTGDLGDVGPGGGRIFYYSAAGFNCGTNFTNTGSPTGEKCKYLEVAPRNWWGGSADTTTSWANSTESISGISGSSIGIGRLNTQQIIVSGIFTRTAAQLSTTYAPTVDGLLINDWYLGAELEMSALVSSPIAASLDVVVGSNHWTSTQVGETNTSARFVRYESPNIVASGLSKTTTTPTVRPIRAF
jgi:hypothetical protein